MEHDRLGERTPEIGKLLTVTDVSATFVRQKVRRFYSGVKLFHR